ncbi:bifunctional glutamate N-acetyltransferase/amino-acid acetyltransferase ArgJ [Rhodovibrionaceae bacterium A322]
MLTRSPLAPDAFAPLSAVAGVELATTAAAIKYQGREDLLVMSLPRGGTVAGVFTTSLTAGAPVLWSRKALENGKVSAVVVNSGNANAFTGKRGVAAVERSVDAVAETLGCDREDVFVASTGVIGEPLPAEKLVAALPNLSFASDSAAWEKAAEAIMTTDTYAKGATAQTEIDGVPVTLSGIAKGSGMIQPDMATMLAFVATDAALPAPLLQSLLKQGADRSFNAITVDSDTSTSDTLLLVASGAAEHPAIESAEDPRLAHFREALDSLLKDLAQQVVKDGEGAQKFVTVEVTGADSDTAARKIGLSIANSPLVKTAIAGEDANWGRIVMAVGKSGQKADADRLAISMGGVPITVDGELRADYDETPVGAHMKGQDILIQVDVGVGQGQSTVWTCDLTHAYIDINADYRS